MSLADNLFRPSERDLVVQSGAPSQLAQVVQASQAAAAITIDSPVVPSDEVWCVLGATFTALPGAAQFCTSITADLRDSNAIFHRWTEFGPVQLGVGTGARTGYFQNMEMYMLPGQLVRALFNLNAGAAANTVIMSFYGLRIPRGNLLR